MVEELGVRLMWRSRIGAFFLLVTVCVFFILLVAATFSRAHYASFSFHCDDFPPLDVFANDLPWPEKVERLKIVTFEIQGDPSQRAFMFVYAGKRSVKGEAGRILDEYREHLRKKLSKREFERIVFIDGGFREIGTTEIYLAPIGADPPKPSPTLKRCEVEVTDEMH